MTQHCELIKADFAKQLESQVSLNTIKGVIKTVRHLMYSLIEANWESSGDKIAIPRLSISSEKKCYKTKNNDFTLNISSSAQSVHNLT